MLILNYYEYVMRVLNFIHSVYYCLLCKYPNPRIKYKHQNFLETFKNEIYIQIASSNACIYISKCNNEDYDNINIGNDYNEHRKSFPLLYSYSLRNTGSICIYIYLYIV